MLRNLHSFDALRAAVRSSWKAGAARTVCSIGQNLSGFDHRPTGGVSTRAARRAVKGAAVAGVMVAIGLLSSLDASAQTDGTTIKTSTGHTLELPLISGLETCDQIESIMAQIDATNYRVGSPDSLTHAGDKELLAYEDRLSAQRYRKCQQRQPQGFLGGVRLKVSQ